MSDLPEKQPNISVPVLYPLGFEPGMEGWREVVNDCFNVAMNSLHEQVFAAGWAPGQGVVHGPSDEYEGVKIPRALGFVPNDGEDPRALTGGDSDVMASDGSAEVIPVGMLRCEPAYGVFMPHEETGKMVPCVTEEKRTYLTYQGGAEAFEKALQNEGAVVQKCWLVWDEKAEEKRKKTGAPEAEADEQEGGE